MLRTTLALALACLLAACGGAPESGEGGAASGGAGLSGAGATFPGPVYARWAEDFRAATGTAVNYQPIGSGGGVKQIKAGTVDFGGTDKPLAADDIAASGLVQFPVVLGGVAPVINVPGVKSGQLSLTGAQLADIFRGEIKNWRDPRLATPGVAMPNLPITVVHRSDASGTTFVFANYLSLKSPAWKTQVGAADALQWPTGIGGKGNDGVAAYVRQTIGAIGYVEYSFAREGSLTKVRLQTRDGDFVEPEPRAFATAAASADWAAAPGYNLLLLDQPGAGAWPITGATFILLRKTAAPEKVAGVLRFFDWALTNGDATAGKLGYVPMPADLKAMVRETWSREFPAT